MKQQPSTDKNAEQSWRQPGPISNTAEVALKATGIAALKLHAGHFAFMRAVVQGIDSRESWNRYLWKDGEYADTVRVNRMIAWIRNEFAAAAKRNDRHGTARLVRIDVRAIADQNAALPTLEDFAIQNGLEDFSAAEQLEQYRTHYGSAANRHSRRSRLIAKQLAALTWLEQLAVQPPQPDDAVGSWLHPDLASKLTIAGIFTLRQLVDRINGLGMRWWSGIGAIGSGKANRILAWLAAHEGSIGLSVGPHATVKRTSLSAQQLNGIVSPSTGIVPIEKLTLSAGLDGSLGTNRGLRSACRISANDDRTAIVEWIQRKGRAGPLAHVEDWKINGYVPRVSNVASSLSLPRHLSNTQRAYLKEAERFLLWAVTERKKPLSSLTTSDCGAYTEFLVSPSPKARWCGPRGRQKWGPLWRPFEGPLSTPARRQTVTIVKNLCSFLVEEGYLAVNPWQGVALPKPAPPDNRPIGISAPLFSAILERSGRLPATAANARLDFALHFFRATGLRLNQAVAANTRHLVRVPLAQGDQEAMPEWTIEVGSPGKSSRRVPLTPELVARLSAYFESRGLDADPAHPSNEGVFLIGRATDVAERAPWSPPNTLDVDPKAGIAAATLYRQLKNFFIDCADDFATTDPAIARTLSAATTRWLCRVST